MSLISYLTRVHFAEHVLDDALGAEIARLGASRPLIVVDADGRSGDGLALLDDALPPQCDPVWPADLGDAFPDSDATTDLGPAVAAMADASCDLILGFGGAAALSLARSLTRASTPDLPLIAVPTTTSDMGLASGTEGARRAGPGQAVPDVILCDPTLTYSIGPNRTAAHGFDALTHCIEAFLAPGFNPPADGIALEGIYRVTHHLEDAVQGGHRAEARREVMASALNAALAGQKGLGGAEALSRAIEAESGAALPHGRLHASVLPPVLNFNAPAVGARYARIAAAMEVRPGADPIAALAEFGARVGLPARIGHLGLGPAALARVAAKAAADPATQTNPRYATKDDYLGLLAQAV